MEQRNDQHLRRRSSLSSALLFAATAVSLCIIGFGAVLRSAPDDGRHEAKDVFLGGERLIFALGDISFAVPEGFGLSGKGEAVPVSSMIPPCDEGFDRCVYYAGLEYEGTNFGSAGMRISLRSDLGSQEECLTAPPEGYVDLAPAATAYGPGFSTSMFAPLRQGAAGHYSDGSQARLWTGDACDEFELRTSESQFANYDPGAIREFTDKDREAITERLTDMLQQVRIKGKTGIPVFP
jgi:hypothetical protein